MITIPSIPGPTALIAVIAALLSGLGERAKAVFQAETSARALFSAHGYAPVPCPSGPARSHTRYLGASLSQVSPPGTPLKHHPLQAS